MVHKDIKTLKEGILFGMGNPLLDILSHADQEFLDKYKLEKDNAILAEEFHLPLYDELFQRRDTEYAPGGSTQNSFKITQWILEVPHLTTFMGCIGNDKYGEIMKRKMNFYGINTLYQVQNDISTGTCAVLVDKDKRSLCAHLGAAKNFSKNFLNENLKVMHHAEYFYISGFFLAVCPTSILQVAQHALQHNKLFMMNLSAKYLCECYKEPMMMAFPYIDILFGNESEVRSFAVEHHILEEDLKTVALKISQFPKKNNNRSRLVIVTRDMNPTILASDNILEEYPVYPIDQKNIVDTNGAGDAFVGGYLSQLIQGKGYEECLDYAHKAAYIIIHRSGCTFPENMKFDDALDQIKRSE
ncbi:unnamed protein product [Gordionus sp. m RMFG-2023]|uniref:uncharacterized protein LOC135931689 n=1 Tax=Gordionus sp. m RMFG-2023 TaxID=3053472 RepID=UPI0030E4CDC5